MRHQLLGRLLLVSLGLLAWVAASATEASADRRTARGDDRALGVMLDAGVPDGVMASVVFRPHRKVRTHLGVGHNAIAHGMRVGLAIRALRSWVSPSAAFTAGYYAQGDAQGLVQAAAGDAELMSPPLRSVGYNFASAHLGLEFGRHRVTFYVYGGMVKLWSRLRNVQEAVEIEMPPEQGRPHAQFGQDPRVRARGPSARIGLIVFF